MTINRVNDLPVWHTLRKHAEVMNRPKNHLKHLVNERNRLEHFSINNSGIFYDFSRQRVDQTTMDFLFKLAESRNLRSRFLDMMMGEKVNVTENRAALHTASRNFSSDPIFLDNVNVMDEINRVKNEIKIFSENIRDGKLTGSTGKAFRHIIVIGIGGSYLGTEFVAHALRAFAKKNIELHFLSNVDIHNFGDIAARIDPETTLWIVISKSYTTSETTANTKQAYEYMKDKGLDPARHFATVTAKGSPGDDPSNPVLKSFHMFDFIGGRYSVTSAVGCLPLSLYLGYDVVERLLKGAEEMDIHAKTAPLGENIPLTAALIGIWNNNFLGYPATAIIPYASPLSKLAPHIQQLYMESNGKSVTTEGEPVNENTGVIVFGEPGTNAQHSFFQLAHQGRPFPIDFIGVINPQYADYQSMSKGVTNHQELWANLISQPKALAVGKDDFDGARYFPGNRPSSTILLNDLEPENIGRLLAFYEAKTIFEAFIWGINPFDQFGVELGKTLASTVRKEMAAKNTNPDHQLNNVDPITGYYIETLFKGRI